MAENCKEMNSREATLLAKIYYQEGMRIITQCVKDSAQIHEVICRNIVGYTNLAFACEVALKVIIVNHNGTVPTLPRGHDLKDLYDKLRSDVKKAISHLTVVYYNENIANPIYTEEMFETDLNRYSNAFEQSRYWYERLEKIPTKEAGIQFILSLSKALIILVSRIEECQNSTG